MRNTSKRIVYFSSFHLKRKEFISDGSFFYIKTLRMTQNYSDTFILCSQRKSMSNIVKCEWEWNIFRVFSGVIQRPAQQTQAAGKWYTEGERYWREKGIKFANGQNKYRSLLSYMIMLVSVYMSRTRSSGRSSVLFFSILRSVHLNSGICNLIWLAEFSPSFH